MKCLSLFSGIGGFDLALQNQGHEIIGACEIDRWARQVFRKQFPGVKIYEDATKINPKELPDFDLIAAGFPCQAFSIAGKRRGFEDTRGSLFFEIVRIAKEKRPRYLLLENVKGLLSHDKGETFRVIISTLDEMGYDVEWQLLNSKYFVPQNRERIFIIGHLRGTGTRKILPLGENSEINNGTRQKTQGEGKRIPSKHIGALDANYYKGGGTRPMIKSLGSIPIPFQRRKNEPKQPEICEYLKSNKSMTLSEISNATGITKTQVEHYFRSDTSGALPDKEDWMKLKRVLEFDNTYDNIMTEYVEDTMKHEMTTRLHDSSGIAPTLTGGEKLIKEPEIKHIHNSDSQANRIYDPEGIGPTLGIGNAMSKPKIRPILFPDRENTIDKMGEESFTLTVMDRHGIVEGSKVKSIQRCGDRNKNTHSLRDESHCLSVNPMSDYVNKITNGERIRRLTPVECERLQGFPDNWTKEGDEGEISDTQRYKMCGNAVTVPVIEYIMEHLTSSI